MPLEKHLLDRISPEDHMALIEARHLFHKAQQAWNRIESGKQCELNVVHHEEDSLAHCLRWGMQAVEDLIELTKGAAKSAKTWRGLRGGEGVFRSGHALDGGPSHESMKVSNSRRLS